MGLINFRNDMHESVSYPDVVTSKEIGDTKIIDFDMSRRVSIIQLEDGRVFWMGLKLFYSPEEFKLPKIQQKKKANLKKRRSKIWTR